MAVDHYGVPFSGIEPDEVDQEQHDAVRDVFFVSHAVMLVRADLFHELGGFDAATFPGADDVDLCWRARLAGARVIVAPSARARHRRATVGEARAAATHAAERRARRDAQPRAAALQVVLGARARLGAAVRVRPRASREALGLARHRAAPGAAARCSRAGSSAFAHPGELRRARDGDAGAPRASTTATSAT